MSVFAVKKAARLHLATMPSVVPTAYEAMAFDPPDGMYQRLQFSVSPPDDPTLGLGYHRERVTAQVFVVDQAGSGTGAAEQYAELVKDRFKKGTTLFESGVRIQILTTPQIAGSVVVQNRLIIPVMIDLVGEVFTA
jgi:hypothetical protein